MHWPPVPLESESERLDWFRNGSAEGVPVAELDWGLDCKGRVKLLVRQPRK